jgi:REP element-mobilizing transposase RayT
MAYQPRDQSPGYHHVWIRGNNKRRIYVDRADRLAFFEMLDRIARKYDWTIIAYCLMGNHYHLVIRVGDRGLSRGMCELNTGWAVQFNRRYGRLNHLFGRRYSNRKIRSVRSLLTTVRYVVQNPTRAGEPGPLEAHVWTSYAATIGLATAPVSLAREELLDCLAPTMAHAIVTFRDFCTATPASGTPRQPP